MSEISSLGITDQAADRPDGDNLFVERTGHTPITSHENRALNAQEKHEGRVVVVSRPLRVSMNMTGKCNIRCIYCHLTFADYFTSFMRAFP